MRLCSTVICQNKYKGVGRQAETPLRWTGGNAPINDGGSTAGMFGNRQ